MAKIRGIKPEMWTDENFVELSSFARLLWIGLWNFACDNGHLQDKSKQIKMRILPTDDVNCAELLREIQGQQLIERADGWITIPNLSHHQKPHKRWWMTCDKPGCELPDGASHAPSNRGTTVAKPLRNRVATADVDVDVDCEGDVEGDVDKTLSRKTGASEPDSFAAFWDAYDKKNGRKAALAKYRLALKKPGVTADVLLHAAIDYIDWLTVEGKHPAFTKDATTWLNGEHWNDERTAREPQLTPGDERVREALRLAEKYKEPETSNIRAIGQSR